MKLFCRHGFIGYKVVLLTLVIIAVTSLTPAMAQSSAHVPAGTLETGRYTALSETADFSSSCIPAIDLTVAQPLSMMESTHSVNHLSFAPPAQSICCEWYYWCDYYFCYYQEYCWYCYW